VFGMMIGDGRGMLLSGSLWKGVRLKERNVSWARWKKVCNIGLRRRK